MAWTGGVTRATGDVITAAFWNNHLGGSGDIAETAPAKVTTKGDLTPATGANALIRLAVGTNDQILQADSSASGGISWRGPTLERAGGQTTEATTTSTSAVDLITAASLSIVVAVPFIIVGSARRTASGSHRGGLGLKLNSTVVQEASASGSQALWMSPTTTAVMQGSFFVYVPPRVSTYLKPARFFSVDSTISHNMANFATDSDMPTATITDVIIRGICSNAAITLGCDEVHVYTLPTA